MSGTRKRELIEGRPALIVIDILESSFMPDRQSGIPHMADYRARMHRAPALVAKARECDVPIVFIQEVHRRDLIDFGRELDGQETVHCLEGNPATQVAKALGMRATDYLIPKRRYSAFFGTDLEILLKGLNAKTLILIGGLTDVCVHYTFVDGHQHDYFCRVVEDCVAGSSEEAHDASLRAMEYLQTGARRTTAEIMTAFEAYRDAQASVAQTA